MIKKIIVVLSILIGSQLTGCATTYYPVPEGYTGPTASVQDSYKIIKDTKVMFFEMTHVDGREVLTSRSETFEYNYGRGFHLTPLFVDRDIPVGLSKLSLRASTYFAAPILALLDENLSIDGIVEVDIQENTAYYVRGEISPRLAVWVEDQNGNIVSEKIENIEETNKE